MARIGPNSPTAPAESMNVPNRVSRSPVSRRIGSTVPRAVVVKTSPMRMPVETSSSGRASFTIAMPAPRPIARDNPHPMPAERSGAPAIRDIWIS